MSTSRARIAAGLLTIALCAGAPAIVTAQGAPFYTVTPCRVIDTRLGTPLSSGVTRIIDVS